MALSFNKFHDFVRAIGLKEHNLHTDTLRIYLTNNAPSAANDAVKGDLAGITEENGYAPADVQNTYTETGGVGTCVGVDVTITASGGSVGPFRYIILYNDTHASDGLIGWWDHGSGVTLSDGQIYISDFGASLFTIG